MKRKLVNIFLVGVIVSLSSCFGNHNEAPSIGENLDSERIYGVRGGEPRQLPNEYPDPTGETLEKIINIQAKFEAEQHSLYVKEEE